MEKRQLYNGEITVYNSIKQLPIQRYTQLNIFFSQLIGIGDNFSSFHSHLRKIDSFSAAGDHEAARQERINLTYNMHMITEGIDIQTRCFLCMVKDINGQPVGDLENDKDCLDAFKLLTDSGCTVGDVEDILEELKKKLMLS